MIYIYYTYIGDKITSWSIGPRKNMAKKFGEALFSGKYFGEECCAINPLFVFLWAMFKDKFIGYKDSDKEVEYE